MVSVSLLKRIAKPYAIVFRHVLTKPVTLKYPYERLNFFEGFRGRIVSDLNRCISCGLCARICPVHAIEMVLVEELNRNCPQIDFGRCSFCGLCVDFCPRNALKTSQIVEICETRREGLIYPPEKLSKPPLSIEERLKELKRTVSVKIQGSKISYVVVREFEK